MALSRTARILIAILLLAAAAFFWVNFFYQSRLAESPAQEPLTASPAPSPATAASDEAASVSEAADAAGEADAEAAAVAGAGAADEVSEAGTPVEAGEPTAEPVDAESQDDVAGESAATGGPAPVDPEVAQPTGPAVADEPPVIVLDASVSVSRDIVIADLPFLVTSPPAQILAAEAATAVETAAAGPVTVPSRATINPFSPVVVRTPPAPTRDVPPAIVGVGATPAVGAPAAPAPAVVTRAPAPTPRPLAPAAPAAAALTRDLPTGSVLSSTPDLLRAPRVGTVADRVDLPTVTAIAIPAAERAVVAAPPTPRTPVDPVVLQPVGPIGLPVVPEFVNVDVLAVEPPVPVEDPAAAEAEAVLEAEAEAVAEAEAARDAAAAEAAALVEEAAAAEPAAATPAAPGVPIDGIAAPLPAGTNLLSRYLRDNNVVFTGSVMGPVSVGVFRSRLEGTPIVVALGQTLPNTEIVLTDLRGMQAELTLDDSTQILSLDLRR
jgi:hypothetical protein